MTRKTFSTLVDEQQYLELKKWLLDRGIPISVWLDNQIKQTITPGEKIDMEVIPHYGTAPIEKRTWMMSNLSNNDQIFTIKSGCEEWLHLVRLWNRGDLEQ